MHDANDEAMRGKTNADSRINFFASDMSFLVLNVKTHIAAIAQNNRQLFLSRI